MTGRRHWAAAAVASLFLGTVAQAEVVDLKWSANGAFEHRQSVAPGRFAEVCGPLAAGAAVRWSFEADAALDFNIHYHVGKDVHYPAQQRGVRAQDGTLKAELAQDYCWMWTNKGPKAVALQARFAR